MTPPLPNSHSAALALASALASLGLAAAVLAQRRRSFASWCFLAGMLFFGAESVLDAQIVSATNAAGLAHWQRLNMLLKAFAPGVWLAFSLTYSRGNYREFLSRWRLVIAATFIILPAIALCFLPTLITLTNLPGHTETVLSVLSRPARILNVLQLIAILVILTNFERTLQSAVGVMRWRMKFLLLGMGLIFGARVYTRSQALLFSSQEVGLIDLETGALLIGCLMIGVSHLRRGFSEAEVYPSHAALQSSVTVLLVGSYLFLVGLLAQWARWLGGSSTFHLQALVILVGIAGLGVLLLSERLRQRVKYFVSRHFRRPHHDFRQVWSRLTERLVAAADPSQASAVAVKVISETFNALSVSVWLLDEQYHWTFGASTSEMAAAPAAASATAIDAEEVAAISRSVEPFDLEDIPSPWAASLRALTDQQFTGRRRLAVALRARSHLLGVAVLGDRVFKLPFTTEEFELLKCLADQLAAALLNFQLGRGLALAQEMETFQTMSAFFVHDLKNSASSLNLMLQNLPQHFDNPEFREDALRGLAATTGRINALIARLSSFRGQLELDLRPTDLNHLIAEVIDQMGLTPEAVAQTLELTESVRIDRERIKSVITNLLSNARDASPSERQVSISTARENSAGAITVEDRGAGMSAEFIRNSLFRPFQTTKKQGLGIGLFQSRMIVEAHGGEIQVQSEPGKGATFRVLLPLPQ